MKKNFVAKVGVLIVCACMLCFCITGCSTEQSCEHNYEIVSTTATCTSSGTTTYQCSLCGDTKTEQAAALGHSFIKNKCSACGYTQEDFSQFTKQQRDSFANTLEKLPTDGVNQEIVDSYAQLIGMQLSYLEDCEEKVSDCEQALEDAKNSRGNYVLDAASGQFIWVQDKKAIAQAEDNLSAAQRSLQNAQADMEFYAAAFELNCYSYVMNQIIDLLNGSADISNEDIESIINITNIRYYLAYSHYEVPDPQPWEVTLREDILEVTGISIAM